jgi:Fe-S cluster biogenesis protein NfuA/nitrite reductase/ring-hydroxylating ferredoxin subunit
MPEKTQFGRIEELIAKIETISNPSARAQVQELIQLLMDLHGAGLSRILEVIWGTGEDKTRRLIIDELGGDPAVRPLLLLYNLHPVDLQTRVIHALEKVRPYLRSHGGNVELLAISENGDVELRLEGSCHGCPSSAMTLKLAIEEAIYEAAPDIQSLSVQGVVEQKRPAGFVPVETLQPGHGDLWQDVQGLEGMDQGAIKVMEVEGQRVLFCKIDASYYAYSSICPECKRPLTDAYFGEAAALVCRACGQRFDALRAGRGLDKPALHLEPFPLLMQEGKARIALHTESAIL